MTMTYDEAVARVTAVGGRFETIEVEHRRSTKPRCSGFRTSASARRSPLPSCFAVAPHSRSMSCRRERLAPFKAPTVVAFRDGPLPRNAAGKMLKRELRDEVTGQQAQRNLTGDSKG
jgi:acyl-CoA synthetase (AMP-forming)/AMP-acid ligase II